MSMLSRYKKTGGFLQLLSLLETSSPAKQAKFLDLIRAENMNWAIALEQRMLSFEKIMKWDDNTIVEITSDIPDLTLAVFKKSEIKDTHKDKLFKLQSQTRLRKVTDLAETVQLVPGAVETSILKFIVATRNRITDGRITIQKIDPSLAVEDKIESKLEILKKSAA